MNPVNPLFSEFENYDLKDWISGVVIVRSEYLVSEFFLSVSTILFSEWISSFLKVEWVWSSRLRFESSSNLLLFFRGSTDPTLMDVFLSLMALVGFKVTVCPFRFPDEEIELLSCWRRTGGFSELNLSIPRNFRTALRFFIFLSSSSFYSSPSDSSRISSFNLLLFSLFLSIKCRFSSPSLVNKGWKK